ncbi:hypothetical protein SCAR479_00756 [Seiridium cardinale]|uniref:DUF6536 domain-containing protein n=1 Tax=Seiridium cardinale TaxID=138064 RepID=A0ABR2Y6S0_9PEZI
MVLLQFRRAKGPGVSGWKRAAHVNSIVLGAITLTLLACLITSAEQTAGLSKAHMFYTGTCDGGSAAQVNVALHLLLNVVSTAIFASSNFFMQVLNSPSRKEVDEIHSKGPWMGIGVPSVRNTFGVSKFKTSCWILLLVPSIPLHLLFNSIIFQTDQRSSDFQPTIASEGFVNAASFYPPGASLTPSGSLATALWGADVDLLHDLNYNNLTYGLIPDGSSLTVSYCLAEPVDQVCQVGLSTTLLLAVTLCVFVKAATAIVVTLVLGRRGQAPLVTLGDAVASFIERPHSATFGMFMVGQQDIRIALSSLTQGHPGWAQEVTQKAVPSLRDSAIISLVVQLFAFCYRHWDLFIFSAQRCAGSRLLLLSFCYLAYNNLFTGLQMAKEWANYSADYYPLRVTDPHSVPSIACSIFLHWLLSNTIYVFISQGGSLPGPSSTFTKSSFLPGYFGTFQQGASDTSLPEGTVISVGYSVYALLGMLIVSVILICIPIGLACQKLPAGSVSVGSNSIAISAACHVSPLSKVANRARSSSRDRETSPSSSSSSSLSSGHIPSRLEVAPAPYSPVGNVAEPSDSDFRARYNHRLHAPYSVGDGDSVEMVDFISRTSQTSLRGSSKLLLPTREGIYEQLARSRIRWGVVKMPSDFYREFETEVPVRSSMIFGVLEDHVATPVYMRPYA